MICSTVVVIATLPAHATDYRLDVATDASSADNTSWFGSSQLPQLNFPSVHGHDIEQNNTTHQSAISAAGNTLSIYYNNYYTLFPNSSASAAVTTIENYATSRFGSNANTRWLVLNEVAAGTWNGTSGDAYRTWLTSTISGLHNDGYHNIVLYAPRYLASKTYASTWQALAQNAYIGLETYLDGKTIKDENFSLSKVQAYYQGYFSSWTSTTSGPGLDPSRLFAGEHFSINNYDPTFYWGANGTSGTDWQAAIEIRNIAIHNIAFGGFIGYAWGKDAQATGDDATDLAAQLSYERAYASAMVVQTEVPAWSGNDSNSSWADYLNWTGGLPSTTNAPYPLLAASNPTLPKQTTANLYNTIKGNTTITLDGAQTITHLGFDSPFSYTIAPGASGSLTITGSGASLNVNSGSHFITAPLRIASATSANITGSLTVSGGFTNAGVTFTKTGAGSMNISGPQSNTANSIFNANDGVTNFNSDVGGNLNLNANSTVNFGSAQNLRSLTIASGKTVTAIKGGTNTVRVNTSWTITGKLDLNDNSAVFDYGSTTPIDSIRQLILSGYNNGNWNGNGIMSTLAQPGMSTTRTAIGFADASSLFSTFPATYAGQTIDSTTIITRYTTSGDANMNGTTDLLDFNLLAANFGKTGMTWRQGDFNYDGTVSITDFNLLAASFGQTVPSTQPPAALFIRAENSNTSIPLPNPAYAGFVSLALIALATRLRARRTGSGTSVPL